MWCVQEASRPVWQKQSERGEGCTVGSPESRGRIPQGLEAVVSTSCFSSGWLHAEEGQGLTWVPLLPRCENRMQGGEGRCRKGRAVGLWCRTTEARTTTVMGETVRSGQILGALRRRERTDGPRRLGGFWPEQPEGRRCPSLRWGRTGCSRSNLSLQPDIQVVTMSWELGIRFKEEVQPEIHLGE